MNGLVLSLFSGIGALDEGFRQAGYCVVSAGDIVWSSLYDVRHFTPPSGRFDGVIAGDPCQSHSSLANLVRAKGLEPRFPDMTPEVVRVVEAARPAWFLRENVPQAPEPKPQGYDVRSFLLDHSTLDSGDGTGHEQMRRRRFCFGVRDGECPELRAHLDFALFVLPDAVTSPTVSAGKGDPSGTPAAIVRRQVAAGDNRAVPVRIGGSGKVKKTACQSYPVSFRPAQGPKAGRSIEDMLDLQGLPRDLFEHSPLTMQGKRRGIGNAVPLPMAVALGRAVRRAMERA
jgi:site-specific DNA-cytosine methylase